ncbi:DNA-binding protein [Neisseria chenwenguii]|uniref:DNA-binding protein n=2 Tax=Neisseria chenwenguii TaxID=1853278 RepID=A0A220S0W7_9NEIS|nr:DNA-binding protein [Neisseria chenwenguii]
MLTIAKTHTLRAAKFGPDISSGRLPLKIKRFGCIPTDKIETIKMNPQLHYGTIVHWFDAMQRGSIIADDSGRRFFADKAALAGSYLFPKTGDRVCFSEDSSKERPTACQVELLKPDYKPGQILRITLKDWDFSKNGGFGHDENFPGQPVFVIGAFLTDQSRIPKVGDCVEGVLQQHRNGQWMLTEAAIQAYVPPESAAQTVRPSEKQAMQRLSENLQTAPARSDIPIHKTPAEAKAAPLQSVVRESAPMPDDPLVEYDEAAAPPANRVLNGTILNWNDEKGFGFIRYGDEHQNAFFHISAFHYQSRRPKNGQAVSFYCKPPVKGERRQAVRVVLRGDENCLFGEQKPDEGSPDILISDLLTKIFTGAAYLLATAYFSYKLAAVYLVLSVITFFLYRDDKLTAQKTDKNSRAYAGRIPENKLHAYALFGGWPGALAARTAFNHKTQKVPFVYIFWFTIAVNIAITYALLIHYADNPILSILKN